jgi:hypothetical protein|tara:strand:- start:554 stop:1276 length:723 start_codon:yes stop_codon:yes gene_type:complete
MKIADIHDYKNGKKRVDFSHLGIYELVRKKLNFRFTKVDGKGYYFEYKNGIYTKSSFNKMQDCFRNHIKTEFENLEINGEVKYLDFLNSYFKKLPLSNGHFAKTYLSEDFELSENELHLFKMETDFSYMNGVKRKEMTEFIAEEKFIETNQLFGIFFSKNDKVFYKQMSENLFLLLNYQNWNSDKNQPTYNLYKVNAKNNTELYKKRNNEIMNIILSFDLNRDLELYKAEIIGFGITKIK